MQGEIGKNDLKDNGKCQKKSDDISSQKISQGGRYVPHGIVCNEEGDNEDDELQIRKKKGNITQMESSSNKDSTSSMTSDLHSKNGISTTDGCISKTVAVIDHVKNKQSYIERTCCKYEEDRPLDCLTPMEKTLLRTKVTTDIYPICQFVAQARHIDSHTCYILKHLGYSGDGKGRECSKH